MRSFPVHIEWELTNYCNMSCIMCPHRIMKRPQGLMSEEVFYKTVDEAKGKTKTSYLHQIGEPLLHPLLIDFINYADSAGIETSISTNCMLLDEQMAEMILDSSLKEIVLCLDSLDKEKYKEIRIGGDLDIVRKNIQYFLQRKKEKRSSIKAIVQMIKMDKNKGEWDKFKKEFGGSVWVKEFSSFAGKVKGGQQKDNRRKNCNKANSHLTIHWNGNVVPCCRDYEGFEIMGNVKKQSIKEIWNSDKYNSFRKNFKTSYLCKNC